MTEIPSFRLDRQYNRIREELEPAVLKTLASTYYIGGPELTGFEEEVGDFLDTPHAIGCANGSDALLLAGMALGLEPGDEVVTTPFTFFSTAGSFSRLGCKPVFVDVREDTYNIDEALIEGAITEKTKAIVVVHLFGQMCDMPAIMKVANKHGIPVIEDAAQAIGAEYDGKMVGSYGTLATYSFYPTKNLGAAGDAGLVTTEDQHLAETVRSLRVHGMTERYHHHLIGANSRLDAMQATVLRVKLPHIDEWNDRRRTIAAMYDSALAEIEQITIPVVDPQAHHIYHHYTIRAEDRDGLREHLQEAGIGTALYYPVPLNQQECFADLGQEDDCPVSLQLSDEVLSLPMYPELTDEEIETVIDAIEEYYQ